MTEPRMVKTARWLVAVVRARAAYKKLGFSRRRRFLNELRPSLQGGRVAYPDALFYITTSDVDRALRASGVTEVEG